MATVAREAGLGKATLSRHFRSRDELISAVFTDRMGDYADVTSKALADPDPWHGFTSYVETVCSMQAEDRGFAVILSSAFSGAEAVEAKRAEALEGFLSLIENAKATGHLRSEFASEDLVVLLMANAGVLAATRDTAPDTWRRLVGHMLRAFAAPGAPTGPLPGLPSHDDLERAMGQAGDP